MNSLPSVFASRASSPVIFQPDLDATTVESKRSNGELKEAIIRATGDLDKIRRLFKGNYERLHEMFAEAIEKKEITTQIELSGARMLMKWEGDDPRDFSPTNARARPPASILFRSPIELEFFNDFYYCANEGKHNWKEIEAIGTKIFRFTASQGYPPTALALIGKEWCINDKSFGYAAQLRPFVGKGYPPVDLAFGEALKKGCQIGSDLFYEGLYWIKHSGAEIVKYPRKDQSFQRATEESLLQCVYDGLGISTSYYVIAPSEEIWENFVKEKLEPVRIAPPEFYLFDYDPEEIRSLLEEYKIRVEDFSPFRKHLEEELTDHYGRRCYTDSTQDPHFSHDYLKIYRNHDEFIGKIVVHKGISEIVETIEDANFQPVIDFIENVMKRSGNARSAYDWLRCIRIGWLGSVVVNDAAKRPSHSPRDFF